MITVDTTVLVYAVGDGHPLRDPCRMLIEMVASGEVRATTTVEVIQEFSHVRARRRPRKDACSLARSYTDLLAPLLTVQTEDLLAGLDVFERSEQLGPFDAVLAATTLRRGATRLASADTSFGSVRGLHHLNPADPAFIDALTAD